jgi:hypothetical protein
LIAVGPVLEALTVGLGPLVGGRVEIGCSRSQITAAQRLPL